MLISRRTFGQAALSGLASASILRAATKIPLAVQLYSVRQLGQKDLASVLENVAKLGFQGVEFAGYYGHEAPAVKKMLDANKLKVAGTHTGLNLLEGDEFQKTVDHMKVIGNNKIIVPSMPRKYQESVDAWKEAGKVFNELSAKLKEHKMSIGYHNHTVEFQKKEGWTETPFDAFFGTAKPEVRVQLDVGHCRRAGADPVDVIKRYKGRVVSIHIKEYNPNNPDAPLGDGLVPWKDVFGELEKQGKTEWYIVEEEGKSCKEYECVGGAIARLKKMGK